MHEVLVVNLVISRPSIETVDEAVWRILWVSSAEDKLVYIDLKDNKALPKVYSYSVLLDEVNSGQCRRIEWVDDSLYVPEHLIRQKHRQKRDEAWELIRDLVHSDNEPLIYDSTFRGAEITKVHRKTGKSRSGIYGYLKRYWQSGKVVNALLPRYQNNGGKGKRRSGTGGKKLGRPKEDTPEEKQGVNVTKEIRQIFSVSVSQWYHTRDKLPFNQVFDNMSGMFFNQGYDVKDGKPEPILLPAHLRPTLRQFQYWYHSERDLYKELAAREGLTKLNLKHRHSLGSARTRYIGQVWQIDATIADVYLVSQLDRNLIIGRPVIYVVIEPFCDLITGCYIGLEGPNWLGAMMALENAASSKVEYCAKLGISIEPDQWPVHYLPEKILGDRGEMHSNKPYHLINTLNVDVSTLPPFRPDWKPYVEQHFNVLNKVIHWQPGAVRDRIKERGQRDYRLDALYTLREFEQIIIKSILYFNNARVLKGFERTEAMIKDDVRPIPRDVWNWGFRNGILRRESQEVLRVNLLPKYEASITANGIVFEGMRYASETSLREQWFLEARNRGRRKIEISVDQRNTSTIYLRHENGRFEEAKMIDDRSAYFNKRLEEVLDMRKVDSKMKRDLEENARQERIALQVYNDLVRKQAKREARISRSGYKLSKSQRLRNIRVNRRNEKYQLRVEQSWTSQSSLVKSQSKIVAIPRVQSSDAGTRQQFIGDILFDAIEGSTEND